MTKGIPFYSATFEARSGRVRLIGALLRELVRILWVGRGLVAKLPSGRRYLVTRAGWVRMRDEARG
ncbi:MAG: hypothetical protein WA208_11600 [Thermoanaerobaculia bacterium]